MNTMYSLMKCEQLVVLYLSIRAIKAHLISREDPVLADENLIKNSTVSESDK